MRLRALGFELRNAGGGLGGGWGLEGNGGMGGVVRYLSYMFIISLLRNTHFYRLHHLASGDDYAGCRARHD